MSNSMELMVIIQSSTRAVSVLRQIAIIVMAIQIDMIGMKLRYKVPRSGFVVRTFILLEIPTISLSIMK